MTDGNGPARDASAVTGFSRGFFGCFGVLAAIAALMVGLFVLTMCTTKVAELSEQGKREEPPTVIGGNVDAKTASIPLKAPDRRHH